MQAQEIDASSAARCAARLNAGGRAPADSGVSRSAASDKPLQLVARKHIPQPQGRERNRLCPVWVETEQPRPNQAV
jgi:hypothetical protein